MLNQFEDFEGKGIFEAVALGISSLIQIFAPSSAAFAQIESELSQIASSVQQVRVSNFLLFTSICLTGLHLQILSLVTTISDEVANILAAVAGLPATIQAYDANSTIYNYVFSSGPVDNLPLGGAPKNCPNPGLWYYDILFGSSGNDLNSCLNNLLDAIQGTGSSSIAATPGGIIADSESTRLHSMIYVLAMSLTSLISTLFLSF